MPKIGTFFATVSRRWVIEYTGVSPPGLLPTPSAPPLAKPVFAVKNATANMS